jgi:cold shock CspA family protein
VSPSAPGTAGASGAVGADAVGTVVEFDPAVGLGAVEASSGGAVAAGRLYRFHCTQIAGGSRTITAGTPVRFEVRPGRNGTWEAFAVTPTAAGAALA